MCKKKNFFFFTFFKNFFFLSNNEEKEITENFQLPNNHKILKIFHCLIKLKFGNVPGKLFLSNEYIGFLSNNLSKKHHHLYPLSKLKCKATSIFKCKKKKKKKKNFTFKLLLFFFYI